MSRPHPSNSCSEWCTILRRAWVVPLACITFAHWPTPDLPSGQHQQAGVHASSFPCNNEEGESFHGREISTHKMCASLHSLPFKVCLASTVCTFAVPCDPLCQVEHQDLLMSAALRTCCDLKQLGVPFQEETKCVRLCICILAGRRHSTWQRVAG